MKVSERIAADIEEYGWVRLPGRAALARRYGVSHTTVSAAAAALRAKGVLAFGRGQPMRVATHGGGEAPVRRCSWETVAAELAMRILNGAFPHGRRMPKIVHVATDHRVSNRTAARAYQHLVTEGLIHRHGRGWYVGTRSGVGAVAVTSPPVVVLLQQREYSWRGLYRPRTEAFPRAFLGEAQQMNVRLQPVVVHPEAAVGDALIGGRENAIRMIDSLGPRYLGTLVAGATDEIPEFGTWVDALLSRNRPVVWFDRVGETFTAGRDCTWFTQCRFSESAAVALALDYLAQRGHRVVAYPDRIGDWAEERHRLAQKLAEEAGMGMRVERHVPFAPTPVRDHTNQVRRALEDNPDAVAPELAARVLSFAQLGPEQETATQGDLRHLTREKLYVAMFTLVMGPIVKDGRATAVMAPNDDEARHIYYWLHAAGLRVPQDLSLISFDNYPELFPLPVTTIDFGFGDLGFQAFHALVGDTPVRRNRHGIVESRPSVVERGSVREVGSPAGVSEC